MIGLQWSVVAIVVVVSAGYAVWTLMPAAWRRRLATALLALPLPARVAVRLRGLAATGSSCACSGCDRNPSRDGEAAAAASAVRPITLHRRLPG